MNRKIALSGLSIVTALTLLGTSAFAAFTTEATATANTFASGTDHLQISTDGSTFADTVPSPFSFSKITPGTTKVFTFYLKNDNTNSNDDLDVNVSFVNGSGDAGLENALTTQFSCTEDVTHVTTTPSAFSVTSMLGGSVDVGTVKSGDRATCTLTVNLPNTADNSVKGKTTTFDVHFDGTGSVPPTPTPTP